MKSKYCARCGRVMTFRKQWANNWDHVKYCSKACRTRRIRPVDSALESEILVLLLHRSARSSICPSEAARRVEPNDWRDLMEACRMAARRLAVLGVVEICQGSAVVDISTAKGPIRIRRGPKFSDRV